MPNTGRRLPCVVRYDMLSYFFSFLVFSLLAFCAASGARIGCMRERAKKRKNNRALAESLEAIALSRRAVSGL